MFHAVCTVEQEVHCNTLQVGLGQTTGGKRDLHMKQRNKKGINSWIQGGVQSKPMSKVCRFNVTL